MGLCERDGNISTLNDGVRDKGFPVIQYIRSSDEHEDGLRHSM